MQLCYWAPNEAAPLLFFYEHVNQFKSFSRCSCSLVSGLNGKYQWAMRKGCSLLLGSQQWLNYSPLEMVCFCDLDSSLLRSCSLQVVTIWENLDFTEEILPLHPLPGPAQEVGVVVSCHVRFSFHFICALWSTVNIKLFLWSKTKQTEAWFPAFLVMILLQFLAPFCF